MGGVDLTDCMIAHYPDGFKNGRCYLRVFFHFVNMCLVNVWILYSMNHEKIELFQFKASVTSSMINVGSMPKNRGRPSGNNESESPHQKNDRQHQRCPWKSGTLKRKKLHRTDDATTSVVKTYKLYL